MLFIEANKSPKHSLKEYIQKWNILEDSEKQKYKKLKQERNKESRAQFAEYIERCTHTINSQKASSIFNSIVSQVKLPPEEANFIEISSKDLPKPPPRSLYHYIMGRLKHDEIFAGLSSETIEQYKMDYEKDILNYEKALKQYIERQ
ncbi:hypothetical protein ROZALSC1DRAFT_31086 [Rozella allomycis CSF55]|uniref:HMG box domain-containing protein n=1 Tax=Rozella allomycis (strain CSF55) TaxID=988480 RepID=A0A4P9YCH8_ROZAC|nr:hypothetical protein ROZALSC1DRAFT_31086 [Rozella allomycis CSF55]